MKLCNDSQNIYILF